MSMDRDDETFGSEARDPEKTAVLAGRTLFGSLFQQNVNRIFGYARHLRKGHEAPIRSDILDAVQDASVNFLSRPRKIKSDSHFVNLFKGFVRNAFLIRQRGERAGKRGAEAQKIDLSVSEVVGVNPPDRSEHGGVQSGPERAPRGGNPAAGSRESKDHLSAHLGGYTLGGSRPAP